MPATDRCAGAWIWPEGTGIRWWTPAQTRWLKLDGPCAWGARLALHELRDRRDRLSLRHGLAEPLGGLLADALSGTQLLRLRLSRALPASWQLCPYEWFTLDGQSAFGRLIVERYSREQDGPMRPLDPARRTVIFNLLDASDPVQPVDAIPNGSAEIIDGRPAVDHFINQVDLSRLGALIVVAHGTEQGGDRPFLLRDGSQWGLPVDRGLPPLVILLACGSDEGGLVVDAVRLLNNGAETVLAPLGRPCPSSAGDFLDAFIERWSAGQRVDEILLATQRPPESARGARLLQLTGRGDLRSGDAGTIWDDLEDHALASASDRSPEALATLTNRLTLRCYQSGLQLEEAETALRALLKVPWHDETAEQALLAKLLRLEPDPWPLTQAWLKPLEALLAEAYDHGSLFDLEQARRQLDSAGIEMPAPAYHYWSKIYYRLGRYALALRDTAHGLGAIAPEAFCTRGAGLVGHLVGLLVDLNLPAPADVLQRRLDDCLADQMDERAAWERHKLMDRAARISLRLGRPDHASAIYHLKRRESRRYGGHGERELAWLLYIGAWSDPSQAAALAAEVDRVLSDRRRAEQAMGPGNADPVYLLRAQAAWAWRAGDEAAYRRVLCFRDLLEERLFNADPGPPGLAFAFLHFCRLQGVGIAGELPPWDRVAAALENGRYFLELAALSALRGATTDTLVMLERLDRQRCPREALRFPAWLGGGVLDDWDTLVAERAEQEQRILAGNTPVTAQQLLVSGLLPL